MFTTVPGMFFADTQGLVVNVKDYGATGNGSTDDAATIQKAITAAGANSGICFPAGTYLLKSPLAVTATNQSFIGVGLGSILKASPSFSGAALITNTGFQQGTISGLKFVGGANFTVSSNPACDAIQFNSDCADWTFSNLQIKSFNGWGIQLIDGATGAIGYAFLDNVNARNCKAGFHFQSTAPATQRGGGIMMTNCVADNTQGGDAFFLDQITDSCLSNCQGYAPVTGSNSLHIKGCGFVYINTFDLGGNTPANACVLLEAGTFGNDHVTLQNMLIQKGTPGLYITGGAQHIRVMNCDIYFNSTHGVQIDDNAGNGPILFSGCQFYQNNQNNAASTYDFNNLSQHGFVTIRDCMFQTSVGSGVGSVAANIASPDFWQGLDVQGNVFAGGTPMFSPAVIHKTIIRDNAGFNPVGSTSAPGIPASTVAQQNQTSVDCMVLVTGGTVSQIAIGGTNTGLTSGWFRVPALQTITLTYTVAPTWLWFGD